MPVIFKGLANETNAIRTQQHVLRIKITIRKAKKKQNDNKESNEKFGSLFKDIRQYMERTQQQLLRIKNTIRKAKQKENDKKK